MSFQKLPEIVNRYLAPPEPIVLHYTVNPAVAPPERPSAWDVEVKMEDAVLRAKMNVLIQSTKESTQTLSKLDEEVSSRARLPRTDPVLTASFPGFEPVPDRTARPISA